MIAGGLKDGVISNDWNPKDAQNDWNAQRISNDWNQRMPKGQVLARRIKLAQKRDKDGQVMM